MSFSVATYALTNYYVPRFLFFSSFLLLFPSISIDDMGATSGVFFYLSFFSLLSNGFLLCDHRLDL